MLIYYIILISNYYITQVQEISYSKYQEHSIMKLLDIYFFVYTNKYYFNSKVGYFCKYLPTYELFFRCF